MYRIIKKYAHNRITFVGLGCMGYPMAGHLTKSGIRVAAFDINKQVVEQFNKEHNSDNDKYDSIESAIKESDALITMLPNFKIMKGVWEQAFKTANQGTYFIDSSTVSPIETAQLAEETKAKGFIPADAPVSGGVMGAQNATLSFMVGSEKENYEKIKGYLNPMGKNFFDCGKNSSGQIAKICNNLCLGITMIGLSESLSLGVKLGIDSKKLSEIMGVSTAACWSLNTYNPIPGVNSNAPSSRDYEKGFSFELISKDINIAKDCADSVGQDGDLTNKALEYYEMMMKENPTKDFSMIYQYVLNNKKI